MASFESAAVTAITLVALSGCFVFIRFLARIAFVKHVGPDDFLITLAWAAALGLAVVTQQQSHSSSQTSSTSSEASGTDLLRQLWSSNITYNLAVLLLKDSLLLQYLRFSIDIGYRRACWALGAIVTIYGLAALFVGVFSCRPVAYSWNDQISGGKCINFLAFWLFNASFNSATDIIVFVLPIPVLSALQLPRKQMAILGSIFVLGAFVCIASIIRLTSVYSATVNNKDNASIAIWSTVEVNIGIMCACLPSFRHPFVQLWPRIIAVRRRLHSGTAAATTVTPELRYQPTIKTVSSRTTSDASSSRPSRTFTVVSGDEEALATPQETPSPTLFELDSELSWPSISKVVDDQSLPIPPIPAILRPGYRPAGPRPDPVQQQNRPLIQRSRSYYLADGGPRSRFPLACIPESRSSVDYGVSGTNPPSPTRSNTAVDRTSSPTKSNTAVDRTSSPTKSNTAVEGASSPSKSVVSLTSTISVSTISSPTRSTATLSTGPVPKIAPLATSSSSPTHPVIPVLTGPAPPIAPASSPTPKSTKIAPWTAAPASSPGNSPSGTPSPGGGKTYTYEILGGPRALEPADANTHLSTSRSRREHARRERERARRKEREHEREAERLAERERQIRDRQGQGDRRPKGPRDMPGEN